MTTGQDLPANVRPRCPTAPFPVRTTSSATSRNPYEAAPSLSFHHDPSARRRQNTGGLRPRQRLAGQAGGPFQNAHPVHSRDRHHFVPARMLDALFDAAACPKARLLVAGAGHTAAALTDPESYWSAVDGFLCPYLNGGTFHDQAYQNRCFLSKRRLCSRAPTPAGKRARWPGPS